MFPTFPWWFKRQPLLRSTLGGQMGIFDFGPQVLQAQQTLFPEPPPEKLSYHNLTPPNAPTYSQGHIFMECTSMCAPFAQRTKHVTRACPENQTCDKLVPQEPRIKDQEPKLSKIWPQSHVSSWSCTIPFGGQLFKTYF